MKGYHWKKNRTTLKNAQMNVFSAVEDFTGRVTNVAVAKSKSHRGFWALWSGNSCKDIYETKDAALCAGYALLRERGSGS